MGLRRALEVLQGFCRAWGAVHWERGSFKGSLKDMCVGACRR